MKIRGPLGLWPFPLLNFILSLAEALAASSSSASSEADTGRGPRKRIYQLVRDEKGRIVEIVEIEA